MKKLFYICLSLLSTMCYAQDLLFDDSTTMVKTVYDLANSDSKTIMLRTNYVRFQFVNKHLDTSDYQTCSLLDSIAAFISTNGGIKNVEIDIHLSLLEWDETYSCSLLSYMYEDIISYLGDRGVDTSYIKGRQNYNYHPIVNCNEMSDEAKRQCFQHEDFRLNRRVEFLITKRQ